MKVVEGGRMYGDVSPSECSSFSRIREIYAKACMPALQIIFERLFVVQTAPHSTRCQMIMMDVGQRALALVIFPARDHLPF